MDGTVAAAMKQGAVKKGRQERTLLKLPESQSVLGTGVLQFVRQSLMDKKNVYNV